MFEQFQLDLGNAQRQTILVGDLLDGGLAELAVVNIDASQARHLRVFELSGGNWELQLQALLRPEVLFVDVVNIGGSERLISYEPGRLNVFDPESRTEFELVGVNSSFIPPRSHELPHVDLTHDVNGDGRDDLVVPGSDGFKLFVQAQSGAFADSVTVGPPADLSPILGADGYRFDPWSASRIHEIDFDLDGRTDLVAWNTDHFEVHTQDGRGQFASLARTFSTDVAFDSDDVYSLATGEMRGTVLHSLADHNADGVADMVLYTLEGERPSKKLSSYELHFGARTAEGGIEFAPEVGAVFRAKHHLLLSLTRHDFDQDGQVDVMLTTIDRNFLEGSLWKKLKGAMGDDLWLELEFYRMQEGRYPDQPNAQHQIALDGPPSHREPGWVPLDIALRGPTHASRITQSDYRNAFNATLLLGDVNGDGLADLMQADHPRSMAIFLGEPGRQLFARRYQELRHSIPSDEEYTWLVDMNADGKLDVLMHHTFVLRDAHGGRKLQPGTESQELTVLLAK